MVDVNPVVFSGRISSSKICFGYSNPSWIIVCRWDKSHQIICLQSKKTHQIICKHSKNVVVLFCSSNNRHQNISMSSSNFLPFIIKIYLSMVLISKRSLFDNIIVRMIYANHIHIPIKFRQYFHCFGRIKIVA